MRLAEFLSVQLGAEESLESPPDLSKSGDVPPLLTVTGQLLALLAWIRSPRGRQAALRVQTPAATGLPSQEESPSFSLMGEAQGQQPLQLEEDQRAWQRLEQLILGQMEELKQQLEVQEEELGRLRLGVGATDSEKRLQYLTLENEALKQSLSLTRDLLLHWGPGRLTRAPQVSCFLGATVPAVWGPLQPGLQQRCPGLLRIPCLPEQRPRALSDLSGPGPRTVDRLWNSPYKSAPSKRLTPMGESLHPAPWLFQ